MAEDLSVETIRMPPVLRRYSLSSTVRKLHSSKNKLLLLTVAGMDLRATEMTYVMGGAGLLSPDQIRSW